MVATSHFGVSLALAMAYQTSFDQLITYACRVLEYLINLASQITVTVGVNCFRHRPVPLLPTPTALTSANPSP